MDEQPHNVPRQSYDYGEYCTFESGIFVGEGTRIRNYVEIRTGTTIGENCYIDSRVSFSGGGTTVGDNVTIRYGAILCKGITIEDNVFICPQVMTNNVQVDGSQKPGITIKKGAFIGTQSVIEAGVTIGEGAVVLPCSYVNKDVPAGARVRGVPAVEYTRKRLKDYAESIGADKDEMKKQAGGPKS